MRHCLLVPLLCLAGVASAGPVAAERLAKEACDALKGEEATLVTAGVRTDMQQGPDWAKSNLAAERLQQISRLIEIEEQLAFRCRVIAAPVKKKGKGGAKAAAADAGATGDPLKKPAVTHAAPDATKPPPKPPTVVKIKPAATGTTSKPVVVKRKPAPPAKVKKPQSTGLFSFD